MRKFARDALLEMKWGSERLGDVLISYVSRGSPDDTAFIRGEDISEIGRSFLILNDDTHIPYHRMKEIRCNEELIWVREGK
jgi:uncharacterized protein (UPF0248 family)